MIFRLLAACLLAFVLALPASAKKKEADAAPTVAPPLYKIADEDSALYLFGTIGAPAADRNWRTRAVARAIDRSESMWFEAPVDDPLAMETANRIFTERGRAAGGVALSSLLDAESRAALEAAAAASGLSMEALDPLRPWAAFVLLSGRVHEGAEGEPAEAALLAEAKGRGRPVRHLFSIEDSLGLLTELPPAAERGLLESFARDFARQRAQADADFAAWAAGDLQAIDASLNAPLRTAAPTVFEKLVAERTLAIADRLAVILSEPGTAFVALNAGYLVGDDALPDALAARGFVVERISE